MSVLTQGLDGATVLVTGASGGIGRAICAALKEAGGRVVGTDIGEAPAEVRFNAWSRHDVTSAEDWTRVLNGVHQQFGRLDCLVNNAGISLCESIANTSIEQWRRVLSVNVESMFLGLKAALPLLRESGSNRAGGSSVVNVSSTAGLHGSPFSAAYNASKGAVTLLTKAAAKEFGALRYPIRVNSLHPGAVETPMLDSLVTKHAEAGFATSPNAVRAAWSAMSSLNRLAQPEEIAAGVVFLCSPAASFMTGAELVIDGGAIS